MSSYTATTYPHPNEVQGLSVEENIRYRQLWEGKSFRETAMRCKQLWFWDADLA